MKAPITQAQAWAVIAESAGWNAKELPVLPEPVCLAPDYELDYMQTHDCGAVYKCGSAGAHENDADIELYTADQLQAYGAACAAHAREMALSESAKVAAATVCDTHIPTGVQIYGSRAGKAIEALKGK